MIMQKRVSILLLWRLIRSEWYPSTLGQVIPKSENHMNTAQLSWPETQCPQTLMTKNRASSLLSRWNAHCFISTLKKSPLSLLVPLPQIPQCYFINAIWNRYIQWKLQNWATAGSKLVFNQDCNSCSEACPSARILVHTIARELPFLYSASSSWIASTWSCNSKFSSCEQILVYTMRHWNMSCY